MPRRDSLSLPFSASRRDSSGRPVRGGSAAAKPILWSGARRRMPLGPATPNSPTPRAATPKFSPVISSGARRDEAAVAANLALRAVAATPRQGRAATPSLLGSGARRASSVAPIASPSTSPPPIAGQPRAFGTPSSAFRRPPQRIAIPADDEAPSPSGPSPSEPSPTASPEEEEEVSAVEEEEVSEGAAPGSPLAPTTPAAMPPPDTDAGIRSGARRQPAGGGGVAASPLAPPKSPGLALRPAEAPSSGRALRLVQVRASAAQRAQTGSERVVTPARRSTRVQAAAEPTERLLEESDYAYAPNLALAPAREPTSPGGAANEAALDEAEAAAAAAAAPAPPVAAAAAAAAAKPSAIPRPRLRSTAQR